MTTLKDIAAEYNEVAARLGERLVNRFPDRATAEKRLAAIRAKLPTEPEPVDVPFPLKWHPTHAKNEAAKTRDKLAVMNEVLAALRAAAEPNGTVKPRKVRLSVFREMPAPIFAGHLRGLSMRGLYSKGKVAMRGAGRYRAPGDGE